MTLRELVAMTEARERSEWARTSSIMALIANVNRDPKKSRPFKPSDFDPFTVKAHKPTGGIDELRAFFQGQPCHKTETQKTSPDSEKPPCT